MAPLNPEQRAAGRSVLDAVAVRARGAASGHSPAAIHDEVTRKALSPVNLVVGAGGTGKSALIHALLDFEGGLLVISHDEHLVYPYHPPILSLAGKRRGQEFLHCLEGRQDGLVRARGFASDLPSDPTSTAHHPNRRRKSPR